MSSIDDENFEYISKVLNCKNSIAEKSGFSKKDILAVRQGLDEFEEVPKFISDSQVRP
jgi:predicted house-cleaning noncanonical NTP pyrophosphatase (MazG superfamily)